MRFDSLGDTWVVREVQRQQAFGASDVDPQGSDGKLGQPSITQVEILKLKVVLDELSEHGHDKSLHLNRVQL